MKNKIQEKAILQNAIDSFNYKYKNATKIVEKKTENGRVIISLFFNDTVIYQANAPLTEKAQAYRDIFNSIVAVGISTMYKTQMQEM